MNHSLATNEWRETSVHTRSAKSAVGTAQWQFRDSLQARQQRL